MRQGHKKKQLMINQLSFLVTALQQPHNTQSINIPRKIIASHGLSTRKADLLHFRQPGFALHEHDRNGHKTGRSSIPGTKPDKNHGGRPAGGFQSGLPKRPGSKRINCCLQTSSQKSIFTLPLTYPGYNPGLHIY